MDSSQATGSAPAMGTRTSPVTVEETRKIVTVIFFDMVDSTGKAERLDLESNERVMDSYRDTVREVIEHHQGTMGPWHGDGAMAVFGIPVLYEDHALRAVRAAADLHGRLASPGGREHGLHPKVRTGIHTGEVLASPNVTPELLTGETPIVANRLQRAAEPDQTLLSEATWQLVRNAIESESVGPLELKGRRTPMGAYRLVSVDPEVQLRHTSHNVPMVGRGSEQTLLMNVYERTVAQSTCHLVTVFGPGGVGKSRLIEEFRNQLKDQATVLAGHCLPYGESITFWPMVQLVRRAADAAATDPPKTVRGKLEALVGDEEDQARITSYLAQMLGVGPGAGPPAEISWALRRLLETLAADGPVVVIVDDLHWAEDALLDAIEHIAEEARGAPVLLVCMAREELLRHRTTWAGGKLNAHSMCLPPLNAGEQEELIGHLVRHRHLDRQAKGLIARLAQGFPLYAFEYVALLEDKLRLVEGQLVEVADLEEKLPAPPTITALLSARLDHLPPDELSVIERAAVVGEQFHTADIVALCWDLPVPTVEKSLRTLLRQELIRPDRSPVPLLPVKEGGSSYRFRHVLTQETAYNRIAKKTRASLHERYATWLESEAGPDRLSQFDELIGSHLGEAYRYRVELGFLSDEDRGLAQRAGERLAAAGRRAAIRGNIELTQRLLNRAVELLPEGHAIWLEASLDRADALREAGQLEGAMEVYRNIIERATATNDQGVAMHARLGLLDVMAFSGPERMLKEGDALVEQAIILFAERGDDLGLAKSRRLKAYMHFAMGHTAAAENAARYAIEVARSRGYEHLEAKIRRLLCIVLFWGQQPLEEVVAYTSEALAWARGKGFPGLEACALGILARAAAMQGDFEKARRLNQNANAITSDLGELLTAAADSLADGFVELLADDPAAAEAKLRVGYEALREMGGTGPLANVAAMLARALLVQGQDDEAEKFIRVCREIAAETQVDSQIRWRQLQGVILARRGELERAEQCATEAVLRADSSEQPDTRAESRMDLAEVLRRAGRTVEATARAHEALGLYKGKGNQVAASTVQRLLDSLA